MDSKLGNTGVPAIDVRFVARYPRLLVSLLLMAAVMLASLVLFQPAPLVDLSAPGLLDKSELFAHWSRGDIVVLVRHAERCDHSTNPCLGATDGITLKGSKVATQLGNDFRRLGLANTQVLSSPLARAQQTSQFMFDNAVPTATWLFNCRKTMLQDTLAHKNAGRNLVLVTHSECFDAFERQMKIPDAPALGFGAALFFSVDASTGKPKMLGYIEETDWQNLPAFALPASVNH